MVENKTKVEKKKNGNSYAYLPRWVCNKLGLRNKDAMKIDVVGEKIIIEKIKDGE